MGDQHSCRIQNIVDEPHGLLRSAESSHQKPLQRLTLRAGTLNVRRKFRPKTVASMTDLLTSRWYGAFFAATGTGLLVAALMYQYALGEEPCQVCIHARLWVSAWLITGLLLFFAPQRFFVRSLGHMAILVAGIGLAERALYLYRLENGIGDGSCEFQLGMPDWFAVDRWLPWLFEVRNLCSFTPEIALGITMAEALLGIAAALSIVAALVWASEFKIWLQRDGAVP